MNTPKKMRLFRRYKNLSGKSTVAKYELEKDAILHALEVVGGNRRKAAELLGIGERTLYDRLKKYGVD